MFLLNFFMNNFVFPRHAKQFSNKLSASGSDLVIYDPTGPSRAKTSGFSGTNDTRHQLPMTIHQNDLPDPVRTNAEVLTYLLEPRNQHYVLMVNEHQKRLEEQGLLKKLRNPGPGQPPILVLIDAGAQILALSNRDVVLAWRKDEPAVYFSEDNRAWIIYGKAIEVPLIASPYAENLEGCLVYIDESHCRGTYAQVVSGIQSFIKHYEGKVC